MRKIIYTIILLLLANLIKAQNKNETSIIGEVKCEDEHVPFVTVMFVGTTIGAVTDFTGHYLISNVKPGKYLVRVQAIGYNAKEKEIEIKEGEIKTLDFEIVEDMILMDAVVVSATRNETKRKDAPVIVNVISPKIFEATQAVSLSEGLNFTPGLRMENNCQNCGFSQLRMNGLDGPYSQVLINSRPIFSALAGVYGLEQIPASMIERVEVIRGGGSALYGGNAIAGTVNVITKNPINNTFQVGSNYALINMEKADASLNFNSSSVSDDLKSGIFIFGIVRDRDNWDANGDGFSEMSTLKNNSFGFMAHHRPTDYSKISIDFHNLNEFRRGGNKFNLLPHYSDITEQTAHNVLGGNISYEIFSEDAKNKLSVYTSAQNVDRDSYYGAEQDINAYGKTQEISLATGVQYTKEIKKLIFASSTLTVGSEYQITNLKDEKLGLINTVIEDHDVGNIGVYTQNEWDLGYSRILLGLRFDKNSFLSNPVLSPRINYLINVNEKMQFRISFAKGFRSPQLFNENLHVEVTGKQSIRHKNSPDLKKESSNSFSTSFDYSNTIGKKQLYFLVEAFYTLLKDPFVHEYTILGDELEYLYHFRRNGVGAEVGGINLESKLALSSKLMFQMGATLQYSKYKEKEVFWMPESGNNDSIISTSKLMRSPGLYGYFVVNYSPNKKLNISVTGTYTGSMLAPHMLVPETKYTILEKTRGFYDMGIKASYNVKLSKKITMQFNVGLQNIFNEFQDDFDKGIYRDAGYVYGPARPRTIFVGIKLGNAL